MWSYRRLDGQRHVMRFRGHCFLLHTLILTNFRKCNRNLVHLANWVKLARSHSYVAGGCLENHTQVDAEASSTICLREAASLVFFNAMPFKPLNLNAFSVKISQMTTKLSESEFSQNFGLQGPREFRHLNI